MGRVLFLAKKKIEKSKQPGKFPSFGGNMLEAQFSQVHFKDPSLPGLQKI